MDKKDVNIRVQRLERLKQATILNYLDSINLNHPMELYDTMMKHLLKGDFDFDFLSDSLLGIDEEEKQEIFQLVRRYKNLCFYMGDASYWADSIEGVYLTDLDLVCMKLLDNFDFLLGLARDGGEDALKLLSSFLTGDMSVNGSVVDYLRNSFINDTVLKEVIIEMAKEDGMYKGLSDIQKEVLCTFPEGTLYHIKGDKVQMINSDELVKKIQTSYFGSEIEDFKDLESLSKLLSNEESFENVILDIYYLENGGYEPIQENHHK